MKYLLHSFVCDARGLEATEYAMLVALVILALIGALHVLSGSVQAPLQQLSDALTGAR
jgi:Flp pilus assembly pilin Flp